MQPVYKSNHIRKVPLPYTIHATLLSLQRLRSVPAGLLTALVVILQVRIVLSGARVVVVVLLVSLAPLRFLLEGVLSGIKCTILGAKVSCSFSPLFLSHCFRLMAIYRLDCHSRFFR